MNLTYGDFLEQKRLDLADGGFGVEKGILNRRLFEWQRDIVEWSLRKGKAALFEDCGLGKTFQQLEFANQVCWHENTNVIILAPLAVAQQTKAEGERFGISVNIIENQADIKKGINITNYEKLDKFNFGMFGGVVLDESSILKHSGSKIRREITKIFSGTPFRLPCTATPAPNDFMEIGHHAEFLGVMSQAEMLATFFVHDSGDTSKWRLKGHAEGKFWEWIASWACVLQKPSDLGYDDVGYTLPPLIIHEHIVKSTNLEDIDGQTLLIPRTTMSLNERRKARKLSLEDRVGVAADIANSIDGQALVWCDLNAESEALKKAINGAVEVKGSDTNKHKTESMTGFTDGSVRALVSKPSIAGWGMNWQNSNNMIFVGLSDSFEAYYQAIRRQWRFGQKSPVNVHLVISEAEGAVKANIERKQRDTERMTRELIKHTQKILQAEIRQTTRITEGYAAAETMVVPDWLGRVAG
ncbi:MAG: DEAD/DEAH box helicase [Oscillospiraceae bacterium]|nr:DEAD/DEAH box helicase [Oscillospiraceae bacterium]